MRDVSESPGTAAWTMTFSAHPKLKKGQPIKIDVQRHLFFHNHAI